VIVALAAVGLNSGDFFKQLFLNLMIFSLFALGLFLITHLMGEISFGHGLYLGLGAYLFALVADHLQTDFWVTALLAVLGAALFGLLTGLVASRLHHIPFAMLSFALSGALLLIAQNAIDLTHGEIGYIVESPGYMDTTRLALLGLVSLLLALFGVRRLTRSSQGMTMRAIRDNEPLAETLGLRPAPYRLAVLTMAATLGGMAGVLYGLNLGSITPEVFTSYHSSMAILIVVVGGRAAPGGALLGATFFVLLPEFLRTTSATLQIIIFAAVLIATLRFMPGGLYGVGTMLVDAVRTRLLPRFRPSRSQEADDPEEASRA
jgi:branched-chain amino acid transport system permease protein